MELHVKYNFTVNLTLSILPHLLFVLIVLVFQAPEEDRSHAKEVLATWASGFRKNSHGGPYLLSEEHRAVLFPKAASWSVAPLEKAHPIMEKIRASIKESLGLGGINLDPSPEEQGRNDEVSEPMVHSGSTTFRPLDSSASSDQSFPGFPSDPNPTINPSPGTSGSKNPGIPNTMLSCPPKGAIPPVCSTVRHCAAHCTEQMYVPVETDK